MKKPIKGKWFWKIEFGKRSPYQAYGFDPYIKIYFMKLKIDLREVSVLLKTDYDGFIKIWQPLHWRVNYPITDKAFHVNEKFRYFIWKLTGIKLHQVYVISYRKYW